MADKPQLVDISSRTILRVILILAAFGLLYFIRDVLFILFVALILAAAMDPFADWFQKRRIPRAFAVIVVYVLLLAILGLIVALVAPPVATQAAQLSERFPEIVEDFSGKYEALKQFSEQYNLPDRFAQFFDVFGGGASRFADSANGVLSRTLSVFGGFASFLVILVISFYFTVDEDGVKKFLKIITPTKHKDYVRNLFERIQYKLAKWVQGQLFLAVIMGIVVGVVLRIVGVPYALVLGLLAGLFELIPVIGPIVAAIPAVILAFFVSPLHGVGVLIFYIVLQQIENHFLVPKIMQKTVGLHPVIVIISMLIGAKIAGVLGILLAVPVATILSVFFKDFVGGLETVDSMKRNGGGQQ